MDGHAAESLLTKRDFPFFYFDGDDVSHTPACCVPDRFWNERGRARHGDTPKPRPENATTTHISTTNPFAGEPTTSTNHSPSYSIVGVHRKEFMRWRQSGHGVG